MLGRVSKCKKGNEDIPRTAVQGFGIHAWKRPLSKCTHNLKKLDLAGTIRCADDQVLYL